MTHLPAHIVNRRLFVESEPEALNKAIHGARLLIDGTFDDRQHRSQLITFAMYVLLAARSGRSSADNAGSHVDSAIARLDLSDPGHRAIDDRAQHLLEVLSSTSSPVPNARDATPEVFRDGLHQVSTTAYPIWASGGFVEVHRHEDIVRDASVQASYTAGYWTD